MNNGIATPAAAVPAAAGTSDVHPATVLEISETVTIVVCGSAESLPLLTKIWEQKASPATVLARCTDGKTFPDVIAALMADDDIPDSFVYVPANCFPTHRVNIADLLAYRTRRKLAGSNPDRWEICHNTGLPKLLHATAVLQTIEKLGAEDFSEEAFFAAYNGIAYPEEVAESIGMTFGNTVAYVVGAPKCMARLSDALVLKRFICADDAGFSAIKDRLESLYDPK